MKFNANRKRLGFESLENRAMLAGNLAASVDGGCLNISGAAKGYQFVVHQLSSGDWLVTGFNNTKVNGHKSETFSDIDCITIKTLGGNDAVGVIGGCLSGPLCVDTGAGSDLVALALLQVGSVDVSTGAGNDALIVAGLKTQEATSTDVTALTTTTQSPTSANFDVGNGTNIVLLAGIQTQNLNFRSGNGMDFVGLAGVCVDECLSVDTGDNADILGIIGSSANRAKLADGGQPGDLLATAQNSFGSTTSNFPVKLNLDPLVKSLNASFKSIQNSMMSSLKVNQFASLPTLKI